MDKTDSKRKGTVIMKEQSSAVTLACKIDKKTFKRFAVYDTLVRRKGWKNPAVFALIMSAFALVCFLGRKTHPQATLLAGVLLCVGLSLPLTWFAMFFSSVGKQARRSGLSPGTVQYFVTLSDEKIFVTKGKESASFQWADAHMARRVKGCIYLFVSPSRAFLLPDCEDTDRAWEIITAKLEPEKIHVKT